jgi:hypothetical protein
VDSNARSSAATDAVDRRAAPRQQFIAEAQIVEISSGEKLSARSCDLVVHGCYVDTLNPFLVGTLVRIQLKKEKTIIEANGSVVYRMPGLGMGIAFHDLAPESHEALQQWLSHTPEGHWSSAASLPSVEVDRPAVPQQPGRLVELVQVLMEKRILTRAEAASLLREPLVE